MGSPESKTRKNTTLILIVLLILSIVSTIYFYNVYKKYNELLTNANNRYEEISDILNKQNKELDDLNAELSKYQNLQDSIKTIKETYFNNAYKADMLARNNEANFKVCYLTFDDGPYLLTDSFLDVLDEKDVLATFFTRKREDPEYDGTYLRQKTSGHTIGNHTASHIIKNIYKSEEIFVEDVKENREFIQDKLGITTDVMRFPGGSYQATYMGLSKSKIVEMLDDIGYGYIDWTHATGDGGATLSPYEFLHNVVDYTADDNVIVILMHDYSRNTLECLRELIDTLTNQGYIFLPLWYDSPAVKKG